MSGIRRCVTCGAPLKGPAKEKGRAFCTERCRMVDLGKWLGEEYKIPGPPADDQSVAEELRRQATDTSRSHEEGD